MLTIVIVPRRRPLRGLEVRCAHILRNAPPGARPLRSQGSHRRNGRDRHSICCEPRRLRTSRQLTVQGSRGELSESTEGRRIHCHECRRICGAIRSGCETRTDGESLDWQTGIVSEVWKAGLAHDCDSKFPFHRGLCLNVGSVMLTAIS